MRRKRVVINILIAFWLLLIPRLTLGEDTPRYSETIAVLLELYKGEVTACKVYSVYAQKALEERYGSVARFFHALRKSKSIHARNFEKLLTALDATVAGLRCYPCIRE